MFKEEISIAYVLTRDIHGAFGIPLPEKLKDFALEYAIVDDKEDAVSILLNSGGADAVTSQSNPNTGNNILQFLMKDFY